MRIYFINIYNSIRKQRIQNSLELKLIKSHRNSIWKHLSNNKCEKSIKYLGCDIKQLKSWLIFQFDECMTMDNYGSYWSLDHILPLSLFDLTKIENQKILKILLKVINYIYSNILMHLFRLIVL